MELAICIYKMKQAALFELHVQTSVQSLMTSIRVIRGTKRPQEGSWRHSSTIKTWTAHNTCHWCDYVFPQAFIQASMQSKTNKRIHVCLPCSIQQHWNTFNHLLQSVIAFCWQKNCSLILVYSDKCICRDSQVTGI